MYREHLELLDNHLLYVVYPISLRLFSTIHSTFAMFYIRSSDSLGFFHLLIYFYLQEKELVCLTSLSM